MLFELIFSSFFLFILCINSNKIKSLPKGLINQTIEEAEYLGYHKCIDAGEAYGASYMITKQHLLLQETNYSLGWVNCEMASFIMMNQRNRKMIRGSNGTIIQSLDVLDFSVIHLSAYERSSRKYHRFIKRYDHPTSNEVMQNITQSLIKRTKTLFNVDKNTPELNRTLVVMPFLGSGMGSGHSVLANRYVYLKTCFWSIYPEMPHIVVGVTSMVDYNYCKNESGLPFYDVILNTDLPKGASNPVSTVQQVKKRFLNGVYKDFDYIFFTESDQILVMRNAPGIYDLLKEFPRYIVIPHRLMPYPPVVLKNYFLRSIIKPEGYGHTWLNMSCCMPRQNCKVREGWLPVRSPDVPVINIYGLYTPLGNSNFLDERYHTCQIFPDRRVDVCP